MKIIATSIIAATVISMSAYAAYSQPSCEDDPRMYRIADFVSEKSQGSVEPMQLTAETFFNLTPVVRDALGDDILLLDAECKPSQILEGAPAARIEVTFASYYNGLHDAVVRGDNRSAEIIRTSFQPAPVDLEVFVSMLAGINTPEAVQSNIAKVMGLAVYDRTAFHHQKTGCQDYEKTFLTLADVFVAGGGIISQENGPSVLAMEDTRNDTLYILPSNFEINKPSISTVGANCTLNAGSVTALVAKASSSVYIYRRFLDKDREYINAWITARQNGDDTPLQSSIFD